MVFGTTLGGALLGAVVAIGWIALVPIDQARAGVILAAAGMSVIGIGFPSIRRALPEPACQVSDTPRLGSLTPAALRWGVTLGLGVCTYVVTPAIYALLGVALGQSGPISAALLCTIYGLTRGITIVMFTVAPAGQETDRVTDAGEGLEKILRVPLALAVVVAVLSTLA